jgi:hypothetical protein
MWAEQTIGLLRQPPSLTGGLPITYSCAGRTIDMQRDLVVIRPEGLSAFFGRRPECRPMDAFSHVEISWWDVASDGEPPSVDLHCLRVRLLVHRGLGVAPPSFSRASDGDLTVLSASWGVLSDQDVLPYEQFVQGLAELLDLPVAVNGPLTEDTDPRFDAKMASVFERPGRWQVGQA